MSYGMRNIIKLSPGDDYGVYVSRTRGPLRTPLQFRGTWDAVTNLNIEVKFSGDCIIYRYDPEAAAKDDSEDDGEYVYVPHEERGLGLPPEEDE